LSVTICPRVTGPFIPGPSVSLEGLPPPIGHLRSRIRPTRNCHHIDLCTGSYNISTTLGSCAHDRLQTMSGQDSRSSTYSYETTSAPYGYSYPDYVHQVHTGAAMSRDRNHPSAPDQHLSPYHPTASNHLPDQSGYAWHQLTNPSAYHASPVPQFASGSSQNAATRLSAASRHEHLPSPAPSYGRTLSPRRGHESATQHTWQSPYLLSSHTASTAGDATPRHRGNAPGTVPSGLTAQVHPSTSTAARGTRRPDQGSPSLMAPLSPPPQFTQVSR
jgi:hypothetical protein